MTASCTGAGNDVEGVEDSGRVGEFVVDGVLVAVERVQGGDLHLLLEGVAAGVEPRLVDGARAARHEVEQPRPDVSVLVAGQINHPGQLFGAPVAGADVMPHVFVDAQRGDTGEPVLVPSQGSQNRHQRAPHRLPRHP